MKKLLFILSLLSFFVSNGQGRISVSLLPRNTSPYDSTYMTLYKKNGSVSRIRVDSLLSAGLTVGNKVSGALVGTVPYFGINGVLQQASNTRGMYYDSASNGFRTVADATHYVAYGVDASGNGSILSTGGSTLTTGMFLTINNGMSTGSSSSANLWVAGSGAGAQSNTTAQFLMEGAGGVFFRIGERGSTNTSISAGSNYVGHMIGEQSATEASSGTHPLFASFGIKPPVFTNAAGATAIAATMYIGGAPTGITGTTGNYSFYNLSGTAHFGDKLEFNSTVTTAGITGAQTINKPTGTVNIAASGTSVTVTNSQVTTSSIVYCVLRTNDATATGVKSVVPGSGSFVITLNAAATAEVSVGFIVFN